MKRKKRIKPASDKRQRLRKIYASIRNRMLTENRVCPVCLEIFGESVRCREIHHIMGRTGYSSEIMKRMEIPLLIDEKYLLAVSGKGHRWIHDNPKEATEKGWLISKSKAII